MSLIIQVNMSCVGGKGFNAAQAHEILAPFVEPISMAILVILLGVIAGGLSFLLVYKYKQSDKPSSEDKNFLELTENIYIKYLEWCFQ